MKKLTLNETADFLLNHDHYAILTHRRPDGDTIGSSAALCRILRKLGKTAHVIRNAEVSDRFAWLHEGLTREKAGEADTIVTVDVASPGMLPKEFEQYLGRIALRIDHHASAASFTENELVDPGMGACAEIIYDLQQQLWVDFDEAIADAIYVGTSTDTGCFRFANTNVHSFDTAAECAAAGADIFAWNQLLFDTNSLEKLRLQGWIAENTKLFSDGKMAICALPRAVEERIGVDEDDLGNMSSFVRSIEGVYLAALLRENEGGCKISLRAVPGWDAAAVCAKFGGGGHAGAAGASVKLPLEEAEKVVAQTMLDWENGL